MALAGGALLLAACSSGAGDASQTVNALWYGKQSDGRIEQGTTPVDVTTGFGSQGGFTIDLSGMRDAGTGEYWNAAAASAAAVGALGAAVDPGTLDVSFEVDESIDGPSAGGLLTVAVLSDLAGRTVAEGKSMTGTVMPDGSLGPVGGIPAKIRAAKEAGITTVVIPAGQRMSTDPQTHKSVDVIEQGRTLGVEVVEAASIADAYTTIVGPLTSQPQAQPPGLDPELATLLSDRATAAIAELARVPVARGSGPQAAYQRLVDSVRDASQIATAALPADPVKAYAAATESLQVVLGWNAGITAGESGIPADQLAQQASRLTAEAEAAVGQAAQTPLDKLEQVPALVDALSWGVDAIAELQVAATNLRANPGSAELQQIASTLAQARYDLEQHLPTAVEAVQVTGQTGLADPGQAWAFLRGYANLLGRAAQANREYVAQAGATSRADPADSDFAQALLQRWQQHSDAGDQASVAVNVATALSAFVGSSLEVNGAGVVAANDSPDLTTSQIRIQSRDTFERQARTATRLGDHQLSVLAGAGLDTSYSLWGARWGELMSGAPSSVKIADEVRRQGLSYQWFANVEAKMLTALARSQSHSQ